jgi:CCR4-NOT transcription complex subunit 2
MPQDALQEAAAQELYSRHWRFHKELKLWFTNDPSSESSKTSTFERGMFIFFDVGRWEKVKKEYMILNEHVDEPVQSNSIEKQ